MDPILNTRLCSGAERETRCETRRKYVPVGSTPASLLSKVSHRVPPPTPVISSALGIATVVSTSLTKVFLAASMFGYASTNG